MSKVFLNVKMIKDKNEEPETVAGIAVYMVKNSLEFEVRSKNPVLKQFIEATLRSNYFAVSPGPKLRNGYYANHAEYYYAGSLNYFTFLADKLSWYGLILDFLNKEELKKSLFSYDIYDFFDFGESADSIPNKQLERIITKSLTNKSLAYISKYVQKAFTPGVNLGDYYHLNDKNEIILERVPPGYMAVSNEGHIVAGGKTLGGNGVNISKPGAKWHLEQRQGGEEEQQQWKLIEAGEDLSEQERQTIEDYIAAGDDADDDLEEAVKKIRGRRVAAVGAGYSPSAYVDAYKDLIDPKAAYRETVPKYFEKLMQIFEKADPAPLVIAKWSESVQSQQLGAEQLRTQLEAAGADDNDLRAAGLQPGNSIRPVLTPELGEDDEDDEEDKHEPLDNSGALLAALSEEEESDTFYLAYSPKLGLMIPQTMFSARKKEADDWKLIDATEFRKLTPQQRIDMYNDQALRYNITGELVHPALLGDAFEKPVRLDKDDAESMYDFSEALPADLAEVAMGQMNSLVDFSREHGGLLVEEASRTASAGVQALEEKLTRQRTDIATIELKRTDTEQQKILRQRQLDAELTEEYFAINEEQIYTIRPGIKVEAGIQHLAKGDHELYATLDPHQEFGVRYLTQQSRYGIYGGAEESQGAFLNWGQGTGKTHTIMGAEAVMRNKGLFDRSMLVVCPNNLSTQWRKRLVRDRGLSESDVVVISGGRKKRAKLWAEVAKAHKDGKPPKYVILGAGKLTYQQQQDGVVTADLSDKAKKALGFDIAEAIRLCGVQSSSGKTGLFDALVLDETGLYTNPDSNRSKIVGELVDAITSSAQERVNPDGTTTQIDGNKGIIWTLNGDIVSNSATDTLSELSWVNSRVRKNFIKFSEFFTSPAGKTARRQFNKNRLALFMHDYLPFINPLSRSMITGAERRKLVVEDPPLGAEFANIHNEAVRRFRYYYDKKREDPESPSAAQTGNVLLGLLSIMAGVGFGGANPARMLEYNLGGDALLTAARTIISRENPEMLETFNKDIQQYLKMVSQETKDYDIQGNEVTLRTPFFGEKGKSNIPKRNEIYEMLPKAYRDLFDRIIGDWHNPIFERTATQIAEAITSHHAQAAENAVKEPFRMTFAGMSRIAIERISTKIKDLFADDKLRVNVITGGMSQAEIDKITKDHDLGFTTSESGEVIKPPPVITFLTGAVTYGLDLHSHLAFVMTPWSYGRLMQWMGRSQRKLKEYVEYRLICPQGMPQIMKQLLTQKGKMAQMLDEAAQIGASGGDAEDLEDLISGPDASPALWEKLIERLEKEAKKAQTETREQYAAENPGLVIKPYRRTTPRK